MANATTKKAGNRKDETPMQTWNEITGIMRVFGNTFSVGKGKNATEITKWSVTVSGKDKNGDWVNYYVRVKFSGKDAHEPDTDGLHTIDINNAFWSVDSYQNKDGEDVVTPVIVVTANDVTE